MTKYRIFVEDIGPGRFSGFGNSDIEARTYLGALRKAIDKWGQPNGVRLLALAHDRRDLWPDGKTGRVPVAALEFTQ